ncbi:Magnesium transporter MgtE [Mycobacterium marinum]|uniref:Magnesium transporter MgtE n=1 Tax=Mycobacterium marinum (strain ATCC BAA-535 / M) TaxID=216594 RepID=B2HPV4_MYCMM|nr:Mg2+ transport transmembrane protein MgtE [Mycobacterium marinum M]AXN42579.1 Magnesium transporter MgtE [Mycobacterium marinum]EPQ71435.1 Mg/Co/Ni transporter [Mycobacterium marinum MB2]EPQ72908.1 Mg/Co/Ni transporter [Mycobacterium marinum str. Europe]AXN48044.1 Magnesium transporter MgtE [Mycobacterium marinum]
MSIHYPTVEQSTIDIRQVVGIGTPKAVDLWLDVVTDAPDRVRELASLSKAELAKLGDLLDTTSGVELFESVDDMLAAEALQAMDSAVAASLLDALDSDHAANILREFKTAKRDALLASLPLKRAVVLRGLLSWPEDSAAAHMVPETLTVGANMTVLDAIATVREHAAGLRSDSRTTAYVYVIDADSHLLGVVAFRALVLADPERLVSELMTEDLIVVSPLTDKELAAQTLMTHNLMAVPVVDGENRLLGIIAEDEALDITQEEATEDAERQGGSAPLEVPYLRASPWLLWRKRVVWLLVLFVAEAYTGSVLRAFSDEMEAVIALAFFIPLLIGTGGNTGTQIATTLVRAMATGQVRFRDVPAVLVKELSTGALVGFTMAVAAVIRAWTLNVGPQVTVTVAVTVAAIVVWSSLVAAILPPLLKKLRIDPAIVSGPLIATIVDGTGLIIYFMIAHLTLTQLQGL